MWARASGGRSRDPAESQSLDLGAPRVRWGAGNEAEKSPIPILSCRPSDFVGLATSLLFPSLSGPVRSTRQRRGANTATAAASAQPGRTGPRRNVSPRLAVATSASSLVDLQSATRKLATDYSNKNVVGVTSGNFENDSLKTKRLIHYLRNHHVSCCTEFIFVILG